MDKQAIKTICSKIENFLDDDSAKKKLIIAGVFTGLTGITLLIFFLIFRNNSKIPNSKMIKLFSKLLASSNPKEINHIICDMMRIKQIASVDITLNNKNYYKAKSPIVKETSFYSEPILKNGKLIGTVDICFFTR